MAAAALAVHRTQAERSATTRARLLDATIECLSELGYARTTTPEIARRAGLSRGAQLHHFPTKAELVTTAVEHLFERRHAEFLEAFRRLPAGAELATAAIDLLWSMVSGPTFDAWLEVAVAARTDPELATAVAALNARFRDMVESTFRRIFPPPEGANLFYDVAPMFAFAVLEGLALHRLPGAELGQTAQSLEALKTIARLVMPPRCA